MNRRALLEAVGAAGPFGLAGLAGCLGPPGTDDDGDSVAATPADENDGDADDGTVFAQGGPRIVRVDSARDVTWRESFAERIRGYAIDDAVFVGTNETVHAVVPE